MKKLFLSFILLMITLSAWTQNELVATLIHNGVFSAYYGTEALNSALNQSEDGDFINLSAGTFTAPSTITKAVSIQGVGMLGQPNQVTHILGSGSIQMFSDSPTKHLSLEGIFWDGTITMQYAENPCFIKCRFQTITSGASCNATNVKMINCLVQGSMDMSYYFGLLAVNSYFYGCMHSSSSPAIFQNCVLVASNEYYSKDGGLLHATFYNCIVCYAYRYSSDYVARVDASVSAYHTLFMNYVGTYVDYSKMQNGYNIWNTEDGNQFAAIFKTLRGGGFTEDEDFALYPTVARQYLGNDSTQIGMQGGPYPYNPIVNYPRITKFNVSSATNDDGMLSVDIEVTNPE